MYIVLYLVKEISERTEYKEWGESRLEIHYSKTQYPNEKDDGLRDDYKFARTLQACVFIIKCISDSRFEKFYTVIL